MIIMVINSLQGILQNYVPQKKVPSLRLIWIDQTTLHTLHFFHFNGALTTLEWPTQPALSLI